MLTWTKKRMGNFQPKKGRDLWSPLCCNLLVPLISYMLVSLFVLCICILYLYPYLYFVLCIRVRFSAFRAATQKFIWLRQCPKQSPKGILVLARFFRSPLINSICVSRSRLETREWQFVISISSQNIRIIKWKSRSRLARWNQDK